MDKPLLLQRLYKIIKYKVLQGFSHTLLSESNFLAFVKHPFSSISDFVSFLFFLQYVTKYVKQTGLSYSCLLLYLPSTGQRMDGRHDGRQHLRSFTQISHILLRCHKLN